MEKKRIIIVLGGGISRDGILSVTSKKNVENAVKLFKKNAKQIVIFSGKHPFGSKSKYVKTEAHAMKEYAISLGVPSDQIIVEESSLDTTGNVYFTNKIVASMKGVISITLIASDFHMRRARYLFEKMFGNRFDISFVKTKLDLTKEELDKRRFDENDRIALLKRVYGKVKNGDFEELSKLIELAHPLYAKDLDTVPGLVWRAFEKRGFKISDLESQRG